MEGRAPRISCHHPSIPLKPSCNTSVVRHRGALGWGGGFPVLALLFAQEKMAPKFLWLIFIEF